MNHFQLNQLLKVVRSLDIAHNPAPEALFDPLTLGFNVWCTPEDNPGGDWNRVAQHSIAAAFSKPCEYVACVFAKWDGDVKYITHFSLSTDAYALADHLPAEYTSGNYPTRSDRKHIRNRPDDIAWAIKKTQWVFASASLSCPPIIEEDD
jgi:hypothetical protein